MKTAKRVLLIEDDPDDQLIFSEVIGRIKPSIECVITSSCSEAFEEIKKPPPFDIIFTDINMPNVNGFMCIRQIKNSAFNKIPVVVLSTSSSQVDKDRAKAVGASLYCVKSHTLDGLLNQISPIIIKDLSA